MQYLRSFNYQCVTNETIDASIIELQSNGDSEWLLQTRDYNI